jgi:hypothetical protein
MFQGGQFEFSEEIAKVWLKIIGRVAGIAPFAVVYFCRV